VFGRGMPEGTRTIRQTEFTAKIYDLLHAYADQRRRTIKVGHVVKVRPVWSIKDARVRLERMLGEVPSPSEWLAFERCMVELAKSHENGKTVMASSFGATLEMAREGHIELRQDGPFAPIYMRSRRAGGAANDGEWQLVG